MKSTKDFSFGEMLNVILVTVLFLCLLIFSWGADYSFLIDPKYYFEAVSHSSDLENALKSGSRWSIDYGFILFSLAINQLFLFVNINSVSPDNYQLVSSAIVSVLLFIAYISILRFYDKKLVFISALMLVVNPSFVGALFNIWRQGFAEFFVLLFIAYYNVRLLRVPILFLACTFHFNTALPFVSSLFSKFFLKRLYISFFAYIIFTVLVCYYFEGLFEQYEVLDVYANTNSKLPWIRLLFCVGTFFFSLTIFLLFRVDKRDCCAVSSICIDDIFRVTFFCVALVLLLGFVFALVMPAASERVMHYYFVLFPIFNLLAYERCNSSGKVLLFLFSLSYLLINCFVVFNSQTWNNVKFLMI
ncbi:hypothetical protein C8J23_12091 [Shewanella chilikensis]|uniref:EpsG family protein n=1 Tax=Shewanella chilikensis TaxID=558541 RepID=A0ABX5PM15_9GAMM|nr:hypothetical protein [Shewanella chilikensis]MCL1152654.1 hypothetical protein [Shewanella chilikensis]PYE57639.1 hypothetical protein C8J23_12091 [Shewanella chilikensis]GGZ40820.1 hypothetical protein GCM10007105_29750 [Shewanella chilikensis]